MAATREISQNIGGVTEAASDTGHNAASVLSESQSLAQQAKDLEGRVDRFLEKVRAM